MLYNFCLSFLIFKVRSVVIFMTWDCGQDAVKECMKQASHTAQDLQCLR